MLCDAFTGTCKSKACSTGDYKCDGNQLMKCNADLTGFDLDKACGSGMCNASAKRCNDCIPNETKCKDDRILLKCSPTGTGPAESRCSGTEQVCSDDRCVECTSDRDCGESDDCKMTVCDVNTGTCGSPEVARLNATCTGSFGAGVCDGNGSCVRCANDDSCEPNEECKGSSGCQARPALTVTTAGAAFVVTLNAGYQLGILMNHQGALVVNYSVDSGATQAVTPGTSVAADPVKVRKIKFTVTNGGTPSTCPIQMTTATTYSMVWAVPLSSQEMQQMSTRTTGCSAAGVSISASVP
jgi:hypothetical protein